MLKRSITVIASCFLHVALLIGFFFILSKLWPTYQEALLAESLTLPMMLVRLALSALTLVFCGIFVAITTKNQKDVWNAAFAILAVGIGFHALAFWDEWPVCPTRHHGSRSSRAARRPAPPVPTSRNALCSWTCVALLCEAASASRRSGRPGAIACSLATDSLSLQSVRAIIVAAE